MLSAINHREGLLCLQDRKKQDSRKRLSSSKKAVPFCPSPMSSESSCSFMNKDDRYSVEDRWTRANRHIFWYPNYMVTFITNMSYFRPHNPDETPSEALPGPAPILTPESPPSKPVNNSKTLNKKYGTIQRRWTNWEAQQPAVLTNFWSVSCQYWLLLCLVWQIQLLLKSALATLSTKKHHKLQEFGTEECAFVFTASLWILCGTDTGAKQSYPTKEGRKRWQISADGSPQWGRKWTRHVCSFSKVYYFW